MTEQDPTAIRGWHAHIYYDADSKPQAAALRDRLGALYPVRLGRMHDAPIGPHPQAMFQIAFAPDALPAVLSWLALNRGGLTVLVHPETSDALADHRDHALWMGAVLPLNLSVLSRIGVTRMSYFPPAPAQWERTDPKHAGFDTAKLEAAIAHAVASETEWPEALHDATARGVFEPPPWNEPLGPFKDRGHVNGLILKGGRVVAEWGTTERVDMTFSITKSYVSTCAGLAWDDGLLPDLDEPVRERVPDPAFDTPHNAPITWRHLLQQTSEWEGELWGKPDMVDRNRDVSREGVNPDKGKARPLNRPGTHWEYNDVRVNLASYAIMRLVGRPLPELLRERIMDPIGASGSWEWNGYRNSWVDVNGRKMQSVSGGGHWGGGLFISSRDHARFGLLMLNRGHWNGRQLLSEKWIEQATTPCDVCPEYGFMWWLNGPGQRFHAGTPRSVFGSGAGGNVLWICPEHDLVAVCRWLRKPAVNEWVGMVREALA